MRIKRKTNHSDNQLLGIQIAKILICLGLLAVAYWRRELFVINENADKIVTFLSRIVATVSVYTIIITVLSLGISKNEEKKVTHKNFRSKEIHTMEEVIRALEENDIIDILIEGDDHIIPIGASAWSDQGMNKIIDKRYYIGEKEFDNTDSLQEELRQYEKDGGLSILAVDDLPPYNYRFSGK